MKRSTIESLKHRMFSNEYSDEEIFGLKDLYKFCSKFEINSIEDIDRMNKELYMFLFENINLFRCKNLSNRDKYVVLPHAINEFFDMISLAFISPANKVMNSTFTDIAKVFLPYGKDTHLLDVGAGRVPIGSMMMSENVNNITAIDDLYIDEDALKKMNITGVDGYLDENTDLSDFDMVVAHKPCEALMDTMKLCYEEDMPYLINVCPCGLPKDKKGEVIGNWSGVLTDIDPRVKIYREGINNEVYAFVLDATPTQVARIINLNTKIKEEEIAMAKFATNLLAKLAGKDIILFE